jgi:hypothetical protein
MSSAAEHVPLFADRFRCPACRKLQFHAEPTEGTGFYQCQRTECRCTWWSATIRQGETQLFLSVVIQASDRHKFRGRPVTELLRALRLMDDVQPEPIANRGT